MVEVRRIFMYPSLELVGLLLCARTLIFYRNFYYLNLAKMTGWFDLYDWPIDISAQEDRTNVQQSAAMLRKEIQSVMDEFQLTSRQIVVGGFSQGGAIALVAAYHDEYGWRTKDRLGGCVNLSGWWPLQRRIESASSSSIQPQNDIPLFWGHGRYDDKVLFEHQAVGVTYLQEEVGVKHILAQQYPIGHSSDPNELRDLANFVDRAIFEGGEQQQDAITSASSTLDKEL
jgi:lysophospholipase II